MEKLTNKVALITGGNSSIGLATAKEFIAQGAKVVITGRNPELNQQALEQLGTNAYALVSDASKIEDVAKLPD